jgi:hypothetical protein
MPAAYPDDFPIFFGLKVDEEIYRFTGYVFIGPGQFNTGGETDTHFHITLENKKVKVGDYLSKSAMKQKQNHH